MSHSLFLYLALSMMLIHEMDAVRFQEWKLFIVLQNLPEQLGYLLFMLIHIPLYGVLLWGLFGSGAASRYVAIGFSAFCMLHVGLHWLFRKHPEYRFRGWFSWAAILTSGLAGAAHILLG